MLNINALVVAWNPYYKDASHDGGPNAYINVGTFNLFAQETVDVWRQSGIQTANGTTTLNTMLEIGAVQYDGDTLVANPTRFSSYDCPAQHDYYSDGTSCGLEPLSELMSLQWPFERLNGTVVSCVWLLQTYAITFPCCDNPTYCCYSLDMGTIDNFDTLVQNLVLAANV